MNLPLHLQMEIDIHAGMHKRDVAEGFAKLRKKLMPEPPRSSAEDLFRNVWSDVTQRYLNDARLQGSLMQTGYLANPLQAANAVSPMNSQGSGLFASFW